MGSKHLKKHWRKHEIFNYRKQTFQKIIDYYQNLMIVGKNYRRRLFYNALVSAKTSLIEAEKAYMEMRELIVAQKKEITILKELLEDARKTERFPNTRSNSRN